MGLCTWSSEQLLVLVQVSLSLVPEETNTELSLRKGMTKNTYVKTVLDAIAEFNSSSKTMKTSLILSMDRRNTFEQAMEAVDLAIKYKSSGVVGVDLCGDYKVSLCSLEKHIHPKVTRLSLGG